VVGEEAALHPVDAQVKAVAVSRGSQRVGSGLLLAVRVLGHGGDELAGGKGKALQLVEDELEVVALGRLGNAFLPFKTCRVKLTRQGSSHLFQYKIRPIAGLRRL
jgi:hypothetical protein